MDLPLLHDPGDLDRQVVRPASRWRRARPRHFSGEPDQRARDGHTRGVEARLVERFGHLGDRTPQLHAQDDGVAIRRLQALERGFVALQRFPADGRLERRGIG